MSGFPYADEFEVHRTLPEEGTDRGEIIAMMRDLSTREDRTWEGGQCSGTMYCGDHDHYRLPQRGVRLLQPRQHAPARHVSQRHQVRGRGRRDDPGHARRGRGPRHHPRRSGHLGRLGVDRPRRPRLPRGQRRPHQPAQHDQARDRAPGVRQGRPPLWRRDARRPRRPGDDPGRPGLGGRARRRRHGGPGGVGDQLRLRDDRPDRGSWVRWPSSAGSGCTSTAAWAASSCPSAASWGIPSRPSTSRSPGSRRCRPTLTSTATPSRARACCASPTRPCATPSTSSDTDWSGGKYCSPGVDGSRSGGLLAATWAAMVSLGRAGYRGYAKKIFETSAAMQGAVAEHAELRILGRPTFLFSFTSDEFDVYLVNDFLRTRGWRLNGQQYPNALHMAVTRPQTQPGVVERWRDRPRRRRRLRDPARRRAREVRRHLRRRRRRHERRGRRVHPRGHGRHDGRPGRRPRAVSAERSSAIDLGTGGPKVGLVSIVRRGRRGRAPRGDHTLRRRRGGDSGRRGVVDPDLRRRAATPRHHRA